MWNPEASVGGYICMALDAGVPCPIFAGLSTPSVPSFIPPGTYPATNAMPAPTGFVVPQACAYVVPPQVGADQIVWKVDCGPELNRDARATLGAALVQQRWTSCGPALGTALFFKGTVAIVVLESSLSPGDYPRFDQLTRPVAGCSG